MRLALHTWGSPAAGKTALLIHGAMASSGTWNEVAPELVKRGYQVIAPDLRGHGDSPHADSYTSEEFAADLVESLPKDADVAIGHSLGGRSLLLAVDALAPERAVYSDPVFVRTAASEAMTEMMVEFAEASKVISEDQVQKMHPLWPAEAVAAEWAGFQVWDVRVMDAIARIGDLDVPAPKIPSLVQSADPRMRITPEYEAHLTRLGYTVRVVKGASHVIHREDLQGFLAALDGWV